MTKNPSHIGHQTRSMPETRHVSVSEAQLSVDFPMGQDPCSRQAESKEEASEDLGVQPWH